MCLDREMEICDKKKLSWQYPPSCTYPSNLGRTRTLLLHLFCCVNHTSTFSLLSAIPNLCFINGKKTPDKYFFMVVLMPEIFKEAYWGLHEDYMLRQENNLWGVPGLLLFCIQLKYQISQRQCWVTWWDRDFHWHRMTHALSAVCCNIKTHVHLEQQ